MHTMKSVMEALEAARTDNNGRLPTLTSNQCHALAVQLNSQLPKNPICHQVRDFLAGAAARENLDLATDRDIYKAEVLRLESRIEELEQKIADDELQAKADAAYAERARERDE